MNTMRVLHVDDEPDIREIVEMSLRLDPQLEVRNCDSGKAALSVAADWQPDIILLDAMMPEMDGPATLSRLRENPHTSAIPVVFMTARAQMRELEQFRSLGAIGVIAKPFDPMSLAASTRGYLQKTGKNLASLRKVFIGRARDDALALERYWSIFASNPNDTEAIARIREIAHGLSGSGGIFGFPEISVEAGVVEDAAIALIAGTGEADILNDAMPLLLRSIANMNSCTPPSTFRWTANHER